MYRYIANLLFFVLSYNVATVEATSFETISLQGNQSYGRINIYAQTEEFDRQPQYFGAQVGERKHFVKADRINISADINFFSENIPIYIVAILDDVPYIKMSTGEWSVWDGTLQPAERRTFIPYNGGVIDIVSGLTGLSGSIKLYVGYGNKSGDILYNSEPLNIQVDEGYDKVLTVGEHGGYSGCEGLQTALYSLQDWNEIRIEQGTYHCRGLELYDYINNDTRHFKKGIKISGGWDSQFMTQTPDPTLTIFDGGTKIVKHINDRNACAQVNGIWITEVQRCLQEIVKYPASIGTKNLILNIGTYPGDTSQDNMVRIETLSFKNAYSKDNAAAINIAQDNNSVENNVYIKQCSFDYNISLNKGGAIQGAHMISGSSFLNNRSSLCGGAVHDAKTVSQSMFRNNASMNGGSVCKVDTIRKSTFSENHAWENGGAVYNVDAIRDSLFDLNTSVKNGGAVVTGVNAYNVLAIVNNTFSRNTAFLDGGALYKQPIYNYNDDLSYLIDYGYIINNLFYNNSAKNGGGIAIPNDNFPYKPKVINNTLVKNKASVSGGAFYGMGTISNSIFSENTAAGTANDITPDGKLWVNYSLFNALSGNVTTASHNLTGNPLFVDPDNHNYRLQLSSPAVDAGDYTYFYTDSDCCTTSGEIILRNNDGRAIDLDKKIRVQGLNIDMGAYEYE